MVYAVCQVFLHFHYRCQLDPEVSSDGNTIRFLKFLFNINERLEDNTNGFLRRYFLFWWLFGISRFKVTLMDLWQSPVAKNLRENPANNDIYRIKCRKVGRRQCSVEDTQSLLLSYLANESKNTSSYLPQKYFIGETYNYQRNRNKRVKMNTKSKSHSTRYMSIIKNIDVKLSFQKKNTNKLSK